MSARLVLVAGLIVIVLGVGALVTGSPDDVDARPAPSQPFQKPVLPESGLTAERSRAVQAELQLIDADRAAWVGDFVAAWDRVLDPATYNVRETLTPIAMRAPAWQLYGASLIGDYSTMLQVLRGARGAGSFVNRIASPERKLRPAARPATVSDLVRPAAFGDPTDQLVFVPIAPCRVVDTRNIPGARTGILAANTSRTFNLTTAAAGKGQGGGPFPCLGLPGGSEPAWVVNLTVVNTFTADGGLKAWAFGAAEPNASVLNWQPGQNGAIANGATVIGCFGCADDLTVKTFGDSAHIIIDVMGYYRPAGVFDAAITRFGSGSIPVSSGTSAVIFGGACPASTSLVGGEVTSTGIDVAIGEFVQFTTTWEFRVINHDSVSRNFTVYSRCMDTPITR